MAGDRQTIPLIRHEVMRAQRARLEGRVVLASSLSSWVLAAVLAAVCALLLGVAVFTHYTRVTTTRGVIVPLGSLANIVAGRAGVIESVMVREGQMVTAGTPLLVVESQPRSENGMRPFDRSLQSIEKQEKIIRTRLRLEADKASLERKRIAASVQQLRSQATELDRQIGLQKELIASAQTTTRQYEKVVSQGVVSRLDFERVRQSYLEREQHLHALESDRDALDQQRADLEGRLRQNDIESLDRDADLRESQERLDQQRAAAEGDAPYIVAAPIAGRVTAIQGTKGRFTDGRATLMTVVPANTTLIAELYAPSRAMALVAEGRPVRLLYDAFPYQRFGAYAGVVQDVSGTVLTPQEVAAPISVSEPVYRVRVRLDQATVHLGNQQIPLEPGMAVTGRILLERRSFLGWLLERLWTSPT